MRKTILVFLACVLILSMTACGGGSPSPGTSGDASVKPDSSPSESDTLEDDALIQPSKDIYANADLTFKVEALSDSSLKIILFDPTLVEEYLVKGKYFSIVWQVQGYNADKQEIFYLQATSPIINRQESDEVTVDMTQTKDVGGGRGLLLDSVTAFAYDVDSGTLIWEIKIKDNKAGTYDFGKAWVNLDYRWEGGGTQTFMMNEAD